MSESRPTLSRSAAGIFAALGLGLVLQGLWIPAKAILAQRLIAHAWERTRQSDAPLATLPPENPAALSTPLSAAPPVATHAAVPAALPAELPAELSGAPPAGIVRPWPWADTWPIAKVQVPRAGVSLYVLAGTSGESLAFGPAHVSESAEPGTRDNVVFAGHRDTHFAFLEEIETGDTIIVESRAGRDHYRVEGFEIVHESRTDVLTRSGRGELTLITCYPFDAIIPGGPLRYVVHAARVASDTSFGAVLSPSPFTGPIRRAPAPASRRPKPRPKPSP